MQLSDRLALKCDTAGDLYRQGRISRAECFKHEVAVSTQKGPGPIVLLSAEAIHQEANYARLPEWITRSEP